MSQAAVRRYRLVNAYESIVRKSVWDNMLAEPDMCKCEKCFLDVCAIVFNKGFTHFATTEQGALLATLPAMSAGMETQLIVVVTEAIQIVKRSPKH